MTSRTIPTNDSIKTYIDDNYGTAWPIPSAPGFLLKELYENDSQSGTGSAPTPSPAPTPPNNPSPAPNGKAQYKIPNNLHIVTENERLRDIFNEMKKIRSYRSSPNTFSVMLRVFLDIAVSDYIRRIPDIKREFDRLTRGDDKQQSKLSVRLGFLKDALDSELPRDVKGLLSKFLDYGNIVSLDTLNFYIHGDIMHPTPEDLRNQWNFIYRFTKHILEYQEI